MFSSEQQDMPVQLRSEREREREKKKNRSYKQKQKLQPTQLLDKTPGHLMEVSKTRGPEWIPKTRTPNS